MLIFHIWPSDAERCRRLGFDVQVDAEGHRVAAIPWEISTPMGLVGHPPEDAIFQVEVKKRLGDYTLDPGVYTTPEATMRIHVAEDTLTVYEGGSDQARTVRRPLLRDVHIHAATLRSAATILWMAQAEELAPKAALA